MAQPMVLVLLFVACIGMVLSLSIGLVVYQNLPKLMAREKSSSKNSNKPSKGKGKGSGGSAHAVPLVCDHKLAKPGWLYTRRVQQGKGYVCPTGFEENGCGWSDGSVLGELQCRKRGEQGRWESPMYGGTGGKTAFKDECTAGHYLSGVTIFHGDYDTNAIFGMCNDPAGIVPPYPLFKNAPNNVYGNYDTPGNAGQWFAKVSSLGFAGNTGRKSHPSKVLTDVVQGFNRWEVNPQKEVKGLRIYGRDGRDTGWAGGTKSGAPLNIQKGECPGGKVITGIQGRAGDRVDAIGFICDTPFT